MRPEGMKLSEVLLIHELLLERFGGMRGVTEEGFGKLDAALAAPLVSMFGEELYPELLDKAAVLFFRLVRSHGFSDGNKRVALIVLLDFLDSFGLELIAGDGAIFDFVMAAASDWDYEQVARWIAAHVRSGSVV